MTGHPGIDSTSFSGWMIDEVLMQKPKYSVHLGEGDATVSTNGTVTMELAQLVPPMDGLDTDTQSEGCL
ncbi:MAG: hypothetical protein P1Q69_05260, partial [Candidatus Thorarchaeota archaeon]|nr:hypothetical protein [Candidatus Thorarchaeota archaeon]